MKRLFTLISAVILTSALAATAYAGNVSGTINFSGTAPENMEIDMNADPTCSGFHSEPVFTEGAVVNSDNTLKNVFVYVKEGLEGQTFDTPKEAVKLDQQGCRYTPHVFGVQVNQPIEIMNSDATLHNVHSLPTQSREFNLGMPIKGMKLKKKFPKPEVMVKFKCDVHPWMSAYAGVLTHPFYSVSGDDGTFTLEGLPAGTYTLEAWHETFGTQTATVTIEEGGEDQVADFAFSA